MECDLEQVRLFGREVGVGPCCLPETGARDSHRILVRGPEFYDKQDIQIRRARAVRIDRDARRVILSDGEAVSYDKLALCPGARPQRLPVPGAELDGVHYLRTAEDVEAIRAAVRDSRRAVIVGGGYIGLETAASLRKLGLEVTMLEAADRILKRVTAPEASDFFLRFHREAGVQVRTDAALVGLEGTSRVSAVRLADGDVLPADIVIVGIGVRPYDGLAQDAGLAVSRTASASTPTVAPAIRTHRRGRGLHQLSGFPVRPDRLESVPSAIEQAADRRAQHRVRRGRCAWRPRSGREFACFYLRGGELIAADCVNRPQQFMFSRRVISDRLPVGPGSLADLSVPIATQLAWALEKAIMASAS